MLVALVQPRIEVAAETARSKCARFHALLQRLEVSEQLRPAGDVESFVDADYLHCTRTQLKGER